MGNRHRPCLDVPGPLREAKGEQAARTGAGGRARGLDANARQRPRPGPGAPKAGQGAEPKRGSSREQRQGNRDSQRQERRVASVSEGWRAAGREDVRGRRAVHRGGALGQDAGHQHKQGRDDRRGAGRKIERLSRHVADGAVLHGFVQIVLVSACNQKLEQQDQHGEPGQRSRSPAPTARERRNTRCCTGSCRHENGGANDNEAAILAPDRLACRPTVTCPRNNKRRAGNRAAKPNTKLAGRTCMRPASFGGKA